MTPFEKHVIKLLRELNRTYGAVVSYLLAVRLGMPDRTVRWWLKRIEKVWGRIARPYGDRSGWVAV